MKKIYTVYLTGLMIIFSYIFTFSIYEIYGLNNVGDSSLRHYQIKYNSGEDLKSVYNYLIKEDSVFQVVKNPMTEDEITYYDIYHTNVNSLNRFVGISNNSYRYFPMTEEEFLDSNGYFSTNLSADKVEEFTRNTGVEIYPVDSDNLLYSSVILNNLLQFFILFVSTFVIIYIYIIYRYKTNAIKKLRGFSSYKIIFTSIKETMKIESILILFLIIGYSIYFVINDRFSWQYILYLFLFLSSVSLIIILFLLLLQRLVKKTDIIDVLKNKVFSARLYFTISIAKILLIISVAIATNTALDHYGKLEETHRKIDEYRLLNKHYSSHGRNSDEYDKLMNNSDKFQKVADNVKSLYEDNSELAYVMFDPVRDTLDKHFMERLGVTREEIMNSYERNYVILNKNYIEEYTELKIKWDFNEKKPTVLVAEKYKEFEEDIKDIYLEKYNSYLNYNSRYGVQVNDDFIDDIQIVYVENGLKYRILSSIPYEDEVDIELTDPVIIVDNGSFGSGLYYDMLGSSELSFKLNNRDTFKKLLIQYELNDLYMANTLLTPFESIISSYDFLLDHAKLFVFLFVILLIFIIYISNYIDMVVNGKVYAARYIQGYHILRNLYLGIATTIAMLFGAITLIIMNINIVIFLLFILYDLVTMLYLYKKLIINQLDKVLNGGY